VVLLPALLITALLDQSGAALFGYEGVYGGIGDGLNFDDIRRSGTVAMFFANLFFLQQVIVTIPTFGANGPLWSLSYELWAYVLFPLLVQAATSSVPTLRRALFVLAAVGILWAGGERLRFCFPLWLLGALAAWAWRRIDLPVRGRGVVRWAAVAGFLVALLASRLRLMGTQDRDDALLGIATTALVLALLATGRPEGDSAPARVYHRVAKHLAGFSYTMYLVHFPPVAVINAALVHPIRWPADARHMGYAGLIAVAAIWLFAYPFSRLTEAHTERVRRRVGQLLGLELQRGTVVASADRAPGE
jgi:peptidoglycan/LPS O-acetylase OafA/YrhL